MLEVSKDRLLVCYPLAQTIWHSGDDLHNFRIDSLRDQLRNQMKAFQGPCLAFCDAEVRGLQDRIDDRKKFENGICTRGSQVRKQVIQESRLIFQAENKSICKNLRSNRKHTDPVSILLNYRAGPRSPHEQAGRHSQQPRRSSKVSTSRSLPPNPPFSKHCKSM